MFVATKPLWLRKTITGTRTKGGCEMVCKPKELGLTKDEIFEADVFEAKIGGELRSNFVPGEEYAVCLSDLTQHGISVPDRIRHELARRFEKAGWSVWIDKNELRFREKKSLLSMIRGMFVSH